MKIVQYMSRMKLEDGGVVRAVLDLCGALAARGHDVTLLACDSSDVPLTWHSGGDGLPRVHTVQGRSGPLPRLTQPATLDAQRIIQPADVLHLHVPWDPICIQLGRIARQAGVPYLVGIHGMLDDWSMKQKSLKKRLYLAIKGRRFLEQAAAVHCTAQAEREQSEKWYPKGRPVVLPLIFDLEEYIDLPGPELARQAFASVIPSTDEPVLLFLSRLHPKKRVDLLIEAAGELRRRGVSFKLLIAGTGDEPYEAQLRQLVKERALTEQIAFVGFVTGKEKVSLYQAAHLFVLPTHQENWGFVLLESLACGTPLVTTRGVDIWSELEAGGGAVIVDAEPEMLAATIRSLLQDDRRRQEMGSRGRSWVLETLHTDRVIDQYEAMYRSLAPD
ncbi:MAG: glycosyltransferase [Planctomycetes bacterium]|nr:glycosyltransferase [Planctomycetota bacterium]